MSAVLYETCDEPFDSQIQSKSAAHRFPAVWLVMNRMRPKIDQIMLRRPGHSRLRADRPPSTKTARPGLAKTGLNTAAT